MELSIPVDHCETQNETEDSGTADTINNNIEEYKPMDNATDTEEDWEEWFADELQEALCTPQLGVEDLNDDATTTSPHVEPNAIYYPSPTEQEFANLNGPDTEEEERPRTSISTPIDQVVRESSEKNDSGYFTGTETQWTGPLSLKKFKQRRARANLASVHDRLAFDRINSTSKFYNNERHKPVRRILFPPDHRKRARTKEKDQEDAEPEGPSIYDPLESYRHVWTEDHRHALYVLRRWFVNGRADVRGILNRYTGAPMSAGAYEFQFNEIGKRKNLKSFEAVHKVPFDDQDNVWEDMKEKLRAAAEGAGVTLIPRDRDDESVMETYADMKKERQLDRMRATFAGFHFKPPSGPGSPTLAAEDLQDESIDPAMLNTPSRVLSKSETRKRKFRSQDEVEQPMVRRRSDRNDLTTDILFRYYDDASFGFNSPTLIRAGLFRDVEEQVPEPLELGDSMFNAHAANHLNRLHTPTPWISCSNSLMWVLRKAAFSRRSASATNPKIVVIDPRLLKKIHRVSDFIKGLCKRVKMIPAAHRYAGHFDFLVWAEIPAEAIVNTIGYFELLHATSVPRHIHTQFRLDIVSRRKLGSVLYGINFAVACEEEAAKAVDDFARIVLGQDTNTIGEAQADIIDRFKMNVRFDWEIDIRAEMQSVSKYFLPRWSEEDAMGLLKLETSKIPKTFYQAGNPLCRNTQHSLGSERTGIHELQATFSSETAC